MTEFFHEIMKEMIPIIAMLLAAGFAYLLALLRKGAAQLTKQVDNETAAKYIDMAYDAVEQAVTFTAQTFVDALKAENAFTKEKQIIAFNTAKNKVLEILGETTIYALREIYGDLDAWLDTRIEQVCYDLKAPALKFETTERLVVEGLEDEPPIPFDDVEDEPGEEEQQQK